MAIGVTEGRNSVPEELSSHELSLQSTKVKIFHHQGEAYLVRKFSPELKRVEVFFVKVDWTMQQNNYTKIDPIKTEEIRRIPNTLSHAFYGIIRIRAMVFGIFKVDKRRTLLDAVKVDNPPIEVLSKGMVVRYSQISS